MSVNEPHTARASLEAKTQLLWNPGSFSEVAMWKMEVCLGAASWGLLREGA